MTIFNEEAPGKRSPAVEEDHMRGRVVGFSRRDFITGMARGTAAAALAFSGAESVIAGPREAGEITLDVLPMTYFGAPLGTLGISTFKLGPEYSTTLRLGVIEAPQLALRPRIPGEQGRACPIGNEQGSDVVKRAITLRQSTTCGALQAIRTGAPGVREHTGFFGVFQPTLVLEGNSNRLRFYFRKAEGTFSYGIPALLNSGLVSRDSALSFISQYVTDRLALIPPRYALRAALTLPAGDKRVFTFSEAGDRPGGEPQTASITARILYQDGFRSDSVKQALAVGNNLEITYFSAQEFASEEILGLETPLERTSPGINEVYWDRVFKTFVIIDAGPVAPFQPVIEGRVTDGGGAAISDATVRVKVNNVEHISVTDSDGAFRIATASEDGFEHGDWTAECGNVSESVRFHGETLYLNLSGVDAISARLRIFHFGNHEQ